MVFWLLTLCNLWILWSRLVSSGCSGSKIRVQDDLLPLSVPSTHSSGPLPPGSFLFYLSRLWYHGIETQIFGPGDDLIDITMHMDQHEHVFSHDGKKLKLVIRDAAMVLAITSLHRESDPSSDSGDVRYTAVKKTATFIEGHMFSWAVSDRLPISLNEIAYNEVSPFPWNDIPRFDIDDVIEAMMDNWKQRIYFPPAYSDDIDMSITRFSKTHPVRALRGRMVVQFDIAKHHIFIAPDDGPNYAHIFALPQGQMSCGAFGRIMKPPAWLKRAEALQNNQEQSDIT